MIAIPNMSKPKSCYNHCDFIAMEEVGCPLKDYAESHQYKDKIHPNCPLIEIDLEKDIPTIWYNRQTRRYEPKGTKQEVYERLYKLKNGERRADELIDKRD